MVVIGLRILLGLISNGRGLINMKFLGFLKYDIFINFYYFNNLFIFIWKFWMSYFVGNFMREVCFFLIKKFIVE
jgi:hypothetical protein